MRGQLVAGGRTRLRRKLSVYVLPVRHPRQPKEDAAPHDWRDDAARLARTSCGVSTRHRQPMSRRTKAATRRTDSSSGRRSTATFRRGEGRRRGHGRLPVREAVSSRPSRSSRIPSALTFLGQGSLLSLSGDRKVGFLVRDIDKVRGRDRPRAAESAAASDAPQMWDFSQPSLYGALKTGWSSDSSPPATTAAGRRQADLRQHRRRPVPPGRQAPRARALPAARPRARSPARRARRDERR